MALSLKQSYWESNTFLRHQDLIIIGGGIVGLSTALAASKLDSQLKITILERGPIPMGASTRNAGFACFGSISELIDDFKQSSKEDVKRIIKMRKQGLDLLRSYVPDREMDYLPSGGYEYFSASQQHEYDECKANLEDYNTLVQEATGLEDTFKIVTAKQFGFKSPMPLIYNQHEGQLNPGKLVEFLTQFVLSQGVRVMNGAQVSHVEESKESVQINLVSGHSVSAAKIVHTSNAFVGDLLDLPDLNPVRNQVYMTEIIPDLAISGCFHCQQGYVYFRNVDDRLLIGGARQHFNTEDTNRFGQTHDVKSYLLSFLRDEIGLPASIDFEYGWSGILAVGESKKPIIKQVSERQYAGVRLGGMGVAIGSLVGKTLADLTFP